MMKSKLDHKYTEGEEWVGLMSWSGKVEGGEGIESQYI